MAAVADSPFAESHARALTAVEAVLVSALLGLGARHLTESALRGYEGWRAGVRGYSIAGDHVLHTYTLGAWLAGVAAMAAIAIALGAGHGRRRYIRVIAGTLGCALVAHVVIDLCFLVIPAVADGLAIAGAVVAAAWVALGRVSPSASRRWLAAPVLAAIAVVTGFPALAMTWGDLAQHHPPFTIEMTAAYDVRGSARVIVNDPHPELVEVSGTRYELDHSDTLHLDAEEIGQITRDGSEIVLHITDTAKARALAKRSDRRRSMPDALYVNGRRLGFPVFQGTLIGGRVALRLEPADAEAMWTALGSP